MIAEKKTDAAAKRTRAADMGVCLDQRRIDREAAAGIWPDRVLTDYIDDALRQRPQATALIAHRCDDETTTTLSFAELSERADRIASNLRRLGVDHGDVVSFQLPNWWEFVAIHLACLRIGAVSNPLMTIFRARELEFMVGFAESRVLIVPKSFQKFDHQALALDLQQKLPALRHVVVVGGDGENSFQAALLGDNGRTSALERTPATPNDVIQLLYTSGTTGRPKGVMHSSNTLLTSAMQLSERLGLTADDVIFMPAPLAHQLGFCLGMMMAIQVGAPLVTMDVWRPARAAELIAAHKVTYACGSTPFLTDLVNIPDIGKLDLEKFRMFLTSGAPIQRAGVEEARAVLGVSVITGWGMTELIQGTATLPSENNDGPITDGTVFAGGEVRVVDADQRVLPPGEEGNFQYRGPTIFIGYFKRPDLYDIGEDGWFDTGDLARLDERGHVRIVGRSKDIIIRGGENIPVFEIENLIYEMPQVKDTALVAMPDSRLGERCCAFVTLQPGCNLELADMIAFLEKQNLARQYLPERLEILDEMPRTPTGKIQKFVLRDIAAFQSSD
ncbi:MAG TPA: AMP-binding protein [Afifellaceae bacterium]|nr:AMP-binding protein [Afifellaceae bacterium]